MDNVHTAESYARMNTKGNGAHDRPSATETANSGPSGTGTARQIGFAVMDPARQRELAAAGGRASHEKGTGHEFTSASGREAAKKAASKRQKAKSNITVGLQVAAGHYVGDRSMELMTSGGVEPSL